MARTVRNPLELRTPVRTISSVMRNAPRQQFRPAEVDFGRPERGGFGDRGGFGGRGQIGGGQDNIGNLTSVTRPARETIAGRAPISQGVTAPISRETTPAGARVQAGTTRAPQAQAKPVTSAIKAPVATTKPVATKPVAKAPVAAKTPAKAPAKAPTTAKTPVAKTTAAKAPVTSKLTTPAKTPVAAKTTAKTPVAAKTTATKLTTPTKPVTPTGTQLTKPTTKPTSSLTSTLKNAAIGAGTAALINKLTSKTPTSPVKPTGIPTKTTKPTNLPTMGGGTGVKPGGGSPTLKPPTSKPTSTLTKAATTAATTKATTPAKTTGTTGTTGTLTDEQIQDELDKAKALEEGSVIPEGAVTNEDGSYSVTADGMVTTYDKDGNIIGMEAAEGTDTTGTDTTTGVDTTTGTDTTLTTGADTTNMTDLGEGYFADADGNIYGADGNLMYTVGSDGEYVDAGGTSASTEDATSWTDPDTGETWNLGADGTWSQEGISTEDATSWTDPDTGFTWNLGADGEWTQEGFGDLGEDTTLVDDTAVSDESDDTTIVDDGEVIEDAKGGSIRRKRHFDDGGYTGAGYGEDEGYSDTGEEVQPFQNVDYNYGEFDDPSMMGGDMSPYQNSAIKNTYLRSSLPDVNNQGYIPSPEGWPDGFIDNGDGTATYVDDDGSTMTIDADNNIVFTTDSEGNVFNPESQSRPVSAITSSGGGIKPSFAALEEERRAGQNQPDQSGVLDSLLNAVRDNPSLAGGAIGALISSLMDQAGSSESASPTAPVDISELTSIAPRTTDFGAGMVGGRTGTGSPLVSYQDYAEGYGDETPDDRLYSDLGISGWLREPDMNDYRDEAGNLTDQSGNLVDEYGYLLDDGSGDYEEAVPEEETAVEDAYEAEEEPAMAAGGTTHYTFGRVMNPAENLGLAQGMKKGGLSQAHTVHSHHTNPVIDNRVDFRKGSAVNGAGDGQSDDIPAWLADGEYVMDAELVSMLGNGSNKAGAKVLDKFREEVRAHKRSAPLGKIPPKAKSPLNYLKEAMNG